MTVTQLRVCVIYYCNMLRPNSRPSSGTTNCVKYKGKYIKIALLQMRSQFHFFLSCYITGEVFIATAVKIGNTDVVSVMVNWAIECVISSSCGILKYSLVTPWSRVLLEKLIVSQPVKKFPAYYAIRSLITASATARHLFLSRATPIQPPSPQHLIPRDSERPCKYWYVIKLADRWRTVVDVFISRFITYQYLQDRFEIPQQIGNIALKHPLFHQ